MKIKTMTNARGNTVKNQYTVDTKEGTYFQSYNTMIALKTNKGAIILDKNAWNYSKTTATYRNLFLGLTTKATQQMIDNGTIKLKDLN